MEGTCMTARRIPNMQFIFIYAHQLLLIKLETNVRDLIVVVILILSSSVDDFYTQERYSNQGHLWFGTTQTIILNVATSNQPVRKGIKFETCFFKETTFGPTTKAEYFQIPTGCTILLEKYNISVTIAAVQGTPQTGDQPNIRFF